jgi:formate hydrogenlyase transcriptional activator
MKDTFQQLLLEMVERFTGIPAERFDAEIELALHVLNDWAGTERCTFYVFSDDCQNLAVYAQSHDDQFPAEATVASQRKWFTKILAEGNVITMSWMPKDLPADADDERLHSERFGIKSMFAFPIMVGNRARYALAANTFHEYRTWGEKLVDRFRLIGQFLGHVVDNKSRAQQQQSQIEEYRAREQARISSGNRQADGWDQDRFGILGQSSAIVRMVRRAALVAPMPTTVLLLGETGTGKELFAWAIHERSGRRGKPFVKVNCAALPPSLVESEFFGHEKGAFTGAIAAHAGRFESADGGTIFLDEIGDLPLELQPKLLRLLQDGEIQRIGSSRTRTTDVRIIAATNQLLERAITEGRFRRDLYYRLSVFPIELPPLRERKEDIPMIARSFIEGRQTALGRRIDEIPPDVMETLLDYDWPGNVRELENVLERAMITSTGGTLRLDDDLLQGGESPADEADSAKDESFDAAAREHVHAVLEKCGWRINGPGGAAEILSVHPNTLRARLKKLGLSRPVRA